MKKSHFVLFVVVLLAVMASQFVLPMVMGIFKGKAAPTARG